MNNNNNNNRTRFWLTLTLIITGFVWYNIAQTNMKANRSNSRIRTAIKKHNESTQKHSNMIFPVTAKPANSKATVIGNDSVRVIIKQ
jgi:ferritin-like metal-binding protein YciE